ncbi:MAG: hypothetical protein IJ762_02090 [Bacteroidaceae bacterium]|nr:hypothetical protein [Bacteroidaceae bacterium]
MNKVALRYQAIYLDIEEVPATAAASAPVMAFVARLCERGYTVSEELLRALSVVPATALADITQDIDEALGVNLNWAPLVKGWDVPTGETFEDHLATWFVNLVGLDMPGTQLPCGHFIPDGTFPLERYNGCPYCGRPFVTANYVHKGQGSKLKELRLMRPSDMQHLLETLLTSPTPLDATQLDSLRLLIRNEKMKIKSEAAPQMRETRMVVVDALVEQGRAEEAQPLFTSPTDILRYLWYKKTGQLQLIEPRTLILHAGRLNRHLWPQADRSVEAREVMRENLRLRYDRRTCRTVARWLNALPMAAQTAAETMNPKRGMWVRMIRALRLGEYGRKRGYDRLRELLDAFYKHSYTTWQGQLDGAFTRNNGPIGVNMLLQRPGLFARSLFAAMLHFGSEPVLRAFRQVADQVPARLLLSLANGADSYFDPEDTGNLRVARPITGVQKGIPLNKLLKLYGPEERQRMADAVRQLFLENVEERYRRQATAGETSSGCIFIAPELYDIPVSVGDRSTMLQDVSCALQGTRFQVEGDSVRLFLQWGVGLPAQHLDMDLSARLVKQDGTVVECAYFNLSPEWGARHSGDIREIPDQVGTAEYVELSLPHLAQSDTRYVVFTCNAYSHGALSPNLMVGWMSSEHPMKISDKDGVAYDPSTVQHIVRIGESNLSKGLVFGVLRVKEREIVWLEMPFTAQTVTSLDGRTVDSLLRRLSRKVSIGQLLEIRARAQKRLLADTPKDADEQYTYEWALNAAEVAKILLIDP